MAKNVLSYNSALKEIEEILYDVENNDVEPELLSEKVKRVSYLLDYCKTKLLETEKQIDEIFEKNKYD